MGRNCAVRDDCAYVTMNVAKHSINSRRRAKSGGSRGLQSQSPDSEFYSNLAISTNYEQPVVPFCDWKRLDPPHVNFPNVDIDRELSLHCSPCQDNEPAQFTRTNITDSTFAIPIWRTVDERLCAGG